MTLTKGESLVLLAIAGLAVLYSCVPAGAITEDDAGAKCAVAIDEKLRDPSSVEHIWERAIIVRGDDKRKEVWTVILPITATNGFGARVAMGFVCRLENGKVVEVER